MRAVIFTVVMVLAIAATSMAADCDKLWPYVMEAKDDMVRGFMQYRMESLESEAGNLIFWDSYMQIECGGDKAIKTPLHWLSGMKKDGEMTPYTAGFLLWLENLKRYKNLDLTPAGLVKGRSFDD